MVYDCAPLQEMTALSLLLTGQPLTTKLRQDTIDPTLDLAVYSYLTRCASSYSALRCALVAVELLRSHGGGAADDAARWATRALEMSALGPIGRALIAERVSACYGARKGVGSGAWGSRRRKAAMWQILAAREWMELEKNGRARGCVEEAAPVYDCLIGWRGIVEVVGRLKRESGLGEKVGLAKVLLSGVLGAEGEKGSVLMSPQEISVGEIGDSGEGERMELGGVGHTHLHKRTRSAGVGALLGLMGATVDDDERVNDDDEFVDS